MKLKLKIYQNENHTASRIPVILFYCKWASGFKHREQQNKILTDVVVLAGELVVFGAVPLQADGRFFLVLAAEDDKEEVKLSIPRSFMKLSICHRHTRNSLCVTNKNSCQHKHYSKILLVFSR